ncbi:hypothetical protein KP509_03G091900 [Ceratopteris richardii]|uniref:CRAL-TRIO domain-containing protein n=1 Tax=Ceratopteris richardii TaxID=49495 RepID=A0A8T2V936_CERRI|nr:hypothetical protein KP509_03G091900 [Ceratopteris richardii]
MHRILTCCDVSWLEELRNALGDLSPSEALYCSDACLKRYLRARNGNISQAKAMLRETLQWRSSYKPGSIRWEDVAEEFKTGKMFRACFTDKLGRPVIVMIPRNQNTRTHEGQVKQLVYSMENALSYLPPDQDQLAWIIDFEGFSYFNNPPLKTTKEVAHILQSHYPERLAVGIVLNAPKIFEYTLKLWKPFIDLTTYKKIRFVYTRDPSSLKAVEDVFDLKTLDLNFKGKYDHAEYARLMKADEMRIKSFCENASSNFEYRMNGQ